MPKNAWWIALVLAGVTGLAWFFAGEGTVGHPAHAPCFSSRDCAKSELCLVVPQADGFATRGTCGEPCQTDQECLNGWRCAPFMESKEGVLIPVGAPGASGRRQLVCAPPRRE